MFSACWKGHLTVCKWLFEVGAAVDITKATNDGVTPMLIARQNGQLSVRKWLVEAGAAADITKSTNYGYTCMFNAC